MFSPQISATCFFLWTQLHQFHLDGVEIKGPYLMEWKIGFWIGAYWIVGCHPTGISMLLVRLRQTEPEVVCCHQGNERRQNVHLVPAEICRSLLVFLLKT